MGYSSVYQGRESATASPLHGQFLTVALCRVAPGIGAEVGPGFDRRSRATVMRACGPCPPECLCSMLLHDDRGRASATNMATQPRPWENGMWMEGGLPDLQVRAGIEVSQWRCPLKFVQQLVLLFEIEELLWPLVNARRPNLVLA